MRNILRNLAVLCGFWATAAVAQLPMQKVTLLFISGSNGFAVYRIPAIVCSTILKWERRLGQANATSSRSLGELP